MKLQNSEVKRIGDTLDRFVKNEIDQDFLKRSHMPFASIRNKIEDKRPEIKTSFGMTSATSFPSLKPSPTAASPPRSKDHAMSFKRSSEVSNVPFSMNARGRLDDARDRNNTLTKTSFAWKAPTFF